MSTWQSMTVGELAARLGAAVEGEAARVVNGVAPLAHAGPSELSWLGDAKFLPRLGGTRAAAVLVPLQLDCEPPPHVSLIRVRDPDLALCRVLEWMAPPPARVPPGVHPTAVIGDGAAIEGASVAAHCFVGPGACVGPGTQLHPGVYVGAGATIGRDCVLWPNVVVRERVTLGERVIVHPNATIGADGFGYLQRDERHVKIPQVGTVVIEDDVEIGANTTIDRAKSGVTRIGRGTKIDNLVQIGHNCDIGEDCVIIAQVGISGSTRLGRNVVVAGQAGVADHVTVGDRVIIAAAAGVGRDVPAGEIWGGSPAREQRNWLREQATTRRLPQLVEQVRELRKRIEQLESSAHDQEAGGA